MIEVYPTKMKAMQNMHKFFENEEDAKAFINSRKNPENYTMVHIEPETSVESTEIENLVEHTAKTKTRARGQKKEPKTSWKDSVDFRGSVQITRENVKKFYKKEGYIRVTDPSGKVLHVGRTRNMGKVFSNYVNCAKYNQSYDFNLEAGDKLMFKEATI